MRQKQPESSKFCARLSRCQLHIRAFVKTQIPRNFTTKGRERELRRGRLGIRAIPVLVSALRFPNHSHLPNRSSSTCTIFEHEEQSPI
jgi:hypothetical protein